MRIHTPSARNLEIYHRLEDDGVSIRDVAEEFWLSPTRVAQIRGQVHRWYQHSAPEPEDKYRRQHAVASCKRHQSRAGRSFATMMDAFRDSQGEEKRSSEVNGRTVTTTRMNHGEPKFLTFALRFSREQRDAALLLATLADDYFALPDVEYVAPTAQDAAVEAEEDRPRLEEEAEHRRKANEYIEQQLQARLAARADEADDEELDDEDFAEDEDDHESPVGVCTVTTPAAPVLPRSMPAASDATAAAEAASEVASILREQHRREAQRGNAPVQPPTVAAKRRDLARALAG